MTLDLKWVENFLVAAQSLSFTETAKRQGTVQSAVSSQMSKLENALGQRLFDRRRGTAMTLTPAGRIFMPQALRLLTVADEAVDAVRSSDGRGTVSLGTTSTLATTIVPDALRDFNAGHPETRIEISCARSNEIMTAFDNGTFDIAFVVDQGKAAQRMFVRDIPLTWVTADGFDADAHESLPLVFLSDGRDLRKYAIAALDRVERKHHIAHLSSDPAGVRAIVSAGLAVTVSPVFAATGGLRSIRDPRVLPEPGELAFSCYAGPQAKSEVVARLSECLRQRLINI